MELSVLNRLQFDKVVFTGFESVSEIKAYLNRPSIDCSYSAKLRLVEILKGQKFEEGANELCMGFTINLKTKEEKCKENNIPYDPEESKKPIYHLYEKATQKYYYSLIYDEYIFGCIEDYSSSKIFPENGESKLTHLDLEYAEFQFMLSTKLACENMRSGIYEWSYRWFKSWSRGADAKKKAPKMVEEIKNGFIGESDKIIKIKIFYAVCLNNSLLIDDFGKTVEISPLNCNLRYMNLV